MLVDWENSIEALIVYIEWSVKDNLLVFLRYIYENLMN